MIPQIQWVLFCSILHYNQCINHSMRTTNLYNILHIWILIFVRYSGIPNFWLLSVQKVKLNQGREDVICISLNNVEIECLETPINILLTKQLFRFINWYLLIWKSLNIDYRILIYILTNSICIFNWRTDVY